MYKNKKMTKGQFWLASLTWGLPMTLVGLFAAAFLWSFGHDIKINQYGLYIELPGGRWGGVSLGPVAIVNTYPSRSLLAHEFGHALQNCYFGPFMIPVGIASLIRSKWRLHLQKKGKELCAYDSIWFEGTATYLGEYYEKN